MWTWHRNGVEAWAKSAMTIWNSGAGLRGWVAYPAPIFWCYYVFLLWGWSLFCPLVFSIINYFIFGLLNPRVRYNNYSLHFLHQSLYLSFAVHQSLIEQLLIKSFSGVLGCWVIHCVNHCSVDLLIDLYLC